MKILHKFNTGKYHDGPHEQCPKYTPEENLMLIYLLDMKVRENHNEDEEIIHTQRFLYYISGQEFHRPLWSKLEVDDDIECHRKTDPNNTPPDGLFDLYFVIFFVEYSDIKREHNDNENEESYPVVQRGLHGCILGD